ncbi:MAG: hypothetical protein JXR73_20575 [Candidatus Omnitrophica bacterium]|nr:hypothetical protein [Candidatus Omnitrophota bacterium]
MTVDRSLRSQALDPPALHAHAMNDLRFIRETMERSTSFTAVPGWGMTAVGGTALITAWAASHASSLNAWLLIWLLEAALALSIGMAFMRYKARLAQLSLFSGAGGRFMLNLFVPILVGIPLTFVLYRSGQIEILPALWLLLYGAGVVTGGMFSVRVVPVMGFCFIGAGIASLFLLPHWPNGMLAFGFGGLHLLFGGIIAWRHGG